MKNALGEGVELRRAAKVLFTNNIRGYKGQVSCYIHQSWQITAKTTHWDYDMVQPLNGSTPQRSSISTSVKKLVIANMTGKKQNNL